MSAEVGAFEKYLHLIDEEAVRRTPRTGIVRSRPRSTVGLNKEERTRSADRVFEMDGFDLAITEPQEAAEIVLQLPSM
jgi:hypothetical protein